MDRQDEALELFTGRNSKKRINCAEAISRVYHNYFNPMGEKELKSFKKQGHGKAPQKVCGAYFAAMELVKSTHPHFVAPLNNHFNLKASSIYCKDIKKNKKLSCEGCVSIAAEFLEARKPVNPPAKKET